MRRPWPTGGGWGWGSVAPNKGKKSKLSPSEVSEKDFEKSTRDVAQTNKLILYRENAIIFPVIRMEHTDGPCGV